MIVYRVSRWISTFQVTIGIFFRIMDVFRRHTVHDESDERVVLLNDEIVEVHGGRKGTKKRAERRNLLRCSSLFFMFSSFHLLVHLFF